MTGVGQIDVFGAFGPLESSVQRGLPGSQCGQEMAYLQAIKSVGTGGQLVDRHLQHGTRRPPFAVLIVVKGDGSLNQSLQERLPVARLLQPDVFNRIVALVELPLVEEVDFPG